MTTSKKKQPADLLDNTAYLVTDVGRLLRRLFDAEMQKLGLSRSEWWLITHLYFFEGCTQQVLADMLDMDKAGLAKLLDRLERKHIIRREIDAADGRQRRIHFGDKARGLAQRVDDASVRTVSGAVKGFKPIEVAALHGLLRRLRETLLEQVGKSDSAIAAAGQKRRRTTTRA